MIDSVTDVPVDGIVMNSSSASEIVGNSMILRPSPELFEKSTREPELVAEAIVVSSPDVGSTV